MKQLLLTGLATEQKFGMAEAQYYLVFNDGELRVPVTEEAAQAVVAEMYGNQEEVEQAPEQPSYTYRSETSSEDEDDGIDQI